MITRFATFTSRLSALFAFLLVLTACGGGGGGGGGGGFLPDDGTNEDAYFLSLALLDILGESTSTITSTMPATLTVKVTRNGPNGALITDTVVTVDSDLATITPATGLTDADGMASFEVTAGEATPGAGAITVSVQNGDGVVTEESINFRIEAPGLRLGYFDSGMFIENQIGVEPESALVFQGTAELTVDIVDENGDRVDSNQSVSFSSECVTLGDATIDPSPVDTVTGSVSSTYTALSCVGMDEVTAFLDGGSAVAFATLTIGSAQANSLTFVSADPELIVLRGTGGGSDRQESAVVTFQVVDADNAPISDIPVSFALSTEIGGLRLTQTSGVSDEEGMVMTTLVSGDIPTSVRVIATIDANDGSGNELSTVSDILTVSTGLPDQNSISLSVEGGFVVENGFNMDGISRNLTVRMADKFNNPVPNGTSAIFTTEYGTIDPSCATGLSNGERVTGGTPVAGECTVLWTSGEPRYPTLGTGGIRTIYDDNYSCPSHTGDEGPCPDDIGATRGGRSTVLVTAIGEESFIDRNGNGIMDQPERDLFSNLPEAWIDHNEDGVFNPAQPACSSPSSDACRSGFEETFVDFNADSTYNQNDNPALYNGLLCPEEGDGVWCSRELVNVRDQTVLILSADTTFDILLARAAGNVVDGVIEGSEYVVYVSDIFNNKPVAGSTITITGNDGCSVLSESTVTVPNTAQPGAFGFPLLTGGDGPDGEGTIVITLNPGGDASPYSETFGCTYIPDDPNDP